MSKVYFQKEFAGFLEGFVPQNSRDVWEKCDNRLMWCYVDPDKPGGRAALTVKSIYNILEKTRPYALTAMKCKGKCGGSNWEITEGRSPDGRYSARLDIVLKKEPHDPFDKKVGRVTLSSTRSGYKKEICCDPEITRDVNDLVEELETMANPDGLLDEIGMKGGF